MDEEIVRRIELKSSAYCRSEARSRLRGEPGTLVRTIYFTAEAGRSYAIEIVPDDAPLYEGGLTENGIRIVAE
jgi:hypothetical protein